jgi:hypothetical protein
MGKLPKIVAQLGLTGALLLAGCKPGSTAPAPLPLNQIPAAMHKAFSNSPSETKELVEKMLGAVQTTNYSAAYQTGQAINSTAGITKEQLRTTSRALLTIYSGLQEASAQGDQAASAIISYQKHTH